MIGIARFNLNRSAKLAWNARRPVVIVSINIFRNPVAGQVRKNRAIGSRQGYIMMHREAIHRTSITMISRHAVGVPLPGDHNFLPPVVIQIPQRDMLVTARGGSFEGNRKPIQLRSVHSVCQETLAIQCSIVAPRVGVLT